MTYLEFLIKLEEMIENGEISQFDTVDEQKIKEVLENDRV